MIAEFQMWLISCILRWLVVPLIPSTPDGKALTRALRDWAVTDHRNYCRRKP